MVLHLPFGIAILANAAILWVGWSCFLIYRRLRRDKIRSGRPSLAEVWSRNARASFFNNNSNRDSRATGRDSTGDNAAQQTPLLSRPWKPSVKQTSEPSLADLSEGLTGNALPHRYSRKATSDIQREQASQMVEHDACCKQGSSDEEDEEDWMKGIIYGSDDLIANLTARNYLKFLKGCACLLVCLTVLIGIHKHFIIYSCPETETYVETLITSVMMTGATAIFHWYLEEPYALSKDLAQASHTVVARWNNKAYKELLKLGEEEFEEMKKANDEAIKEDDDWHSTTESPRFRNSANAPYTSTPVNFSSNLTADVDESIRIGRFQLDTGRAPRDSRATMVSRQLSGGYSPASSSSASAPAVADARSVARATIPSPSSRRTSSSSADVHQFHPRGQSFRLSDLLFSQALDGRGSTHRAQSMPCRPAATMGEEDRAWKI